MSPEFAAREIALIIQHWVDRDEANRKREGLQTTDDTNIISPPLWPTHGELKLWARELNATADRIELLVENLEQIRGHLGACIVQRSRSDDAVIFEHIQAAYELTNRTAERQP